MYNEGKEVLEYKCKSRILKILNVCLGYLACMINQWNVWKSRVPFFMNNFDWHLKQNSGLSHMVCKQRGDSAVCCGNRAENSHWNIVVKLKYQTRTAWFSGTELVIGTYEYAVKMPKLQIDWLAKSWSTGLFENGSLTS